MKTALAPLALVVVGFAAAADRSAPSAGTPAQVRTTDTAPGFDLGESIEKVQCRMIRAPGTPGRLEAAGRRYRISLDRSGLRLTASQPSRPRKTGSSPRARDGGLVEGGEGTCAGLQPRCRELRPRGLAAPPASPDRDPCEATPDPSSEFHVDLTRVAIDGAPLRVYIGSWFETENAASRSIGPGLTERVTARRESAEWEFLLERVPAGELCVEAFVTAAGPAERVQEPAIGGSSRTTPHAWRWPLGSGRFARMGPMIVQDAAGHTLYSALPAIEEGLVRLVVPAEAFTGARGPLTIDPVVSIEDSVADPALSLASNDQFTPRAAWNGSSWLLAWTDNRAGNPDVYGARVDAAGDLLDPTGIPIALGPESQAYPAVASDGEGFLVAWEEHGADGRSRIVTARVSGEGTVLDVPGVVIAAGPGDQLFPAAAWGGAAWLVAWEDHRCGPVVCGEIYAARIGPTGAVLDPSGIPVGPGPGVRQFPAADSDGTNWLLVWEEGAAGAKTIFGARLAPTGTVLDPLPIAISDLAGDQRSPAVAWDGTQHLAVWEDQGCGNASCADVAGARVTASGVVLDPDAIVVSAAAGAQSLPALASDGSGWLVVWSDARSGATYDIYGARVGLDGTVVDPSGIPISTAANSQFGPTLAWDGERFLAAWEDDRCGGPACSDVYASRIEPGGAVLEAGGRAISRAAPSQASPAAAFDGENFLVVWEENRTGQTDIVGARVTPSGTLLDGEGVGISAAPFDQRSPALAWNGSEFLVVWEDDRCGGESCSDVYGARVSASGTVLDPSGIAISTGDGQQFAPAVSAAGGPVLVAWLDARAGLAAFASRVSAAGEVLEPEGIRIGTFSDGQGSPGLASDGFGWIVTTVDFERASGYDVFASRVSESGALLDDPPIVISAAPSGQSAPVVSWDGANYLIVWEDFRSRSSYDIYGARVSPAGQVLDPSGIPITTEADHQFAPSVAWDGYSHIVVWEDLRSGRSSDLYAARVSAAGTLVPALSNGLAVADTESEEGSPHTVSAGAGRVAIVYDRFSSDPDHHARRAFVRFVDECRQEGALDGLECPFVLVSPRDGTLLPTSGAPPTFWWGQGGLLRFRVEFSARSDFAKRRILSRKTLSAGATYTPDSKKWVRIKKLAPAGLPIYWRVVGKVPRVARRTLSPPFALTIAP